MEELAFRAAGRGEFFPRKSACTDAGIRRVRKPSPRGFRMEMDWTSRRRRRMPGCLILPARAEY
jgi:hypothetical protein